jgi:hypothetical protein
MTPECKNVLQEAKDLAGMAADMVNRTDRLDEYMTRRLIKHLIKCASLIQSLCDQRSPEVTKSE